MKQDSLYMLIRGMTKQEKIFFNRFAQLANNKKNKHYLRLFKRIDRQLKKTSVVDEASLKGEFPYLSVEKRYLMNIIIKSLTAFHEKDEGFYMVKTLIKQIYILLDKRIYPEAQKLHKKAVELAEKYNLFEDLLALQNVRVVLQGIDKLVPEGAIMEDIIAQKKQLVAQSQNYDEYRLHMHKLQQWIHENGYIDTPQKEEEFKELIDTPLIKNKDQAISGRATELYYNANIFICELQYDFDKKYQIFQQRIAFMREYPELYSPYNKMIFTHNYVLCCTRVKAVEEGKKYLQELEQQIQAYPLDAGFIKGLLYMRCLDFNSVIGAFDQHEYWIPKVEEGLKTYFYIPAIQLEYIHLFLGRAYIEIGAYEKALDCLYKVGDHKMFEKMSVIYSAAKLLILICYYELGWYSNLESASLSFYRLVRKVGIQYKLYELLIKYLKLKIANRDLTNEDTIRFFYAEWEEIQPNSRESIPFQFFHYKEWLRSKIEGKPLAFYLSE